MHEINQLTVDLTSFDVRAKLVDFFKKEFPEILDSVLTELFDDNTFVKLDDLEIVLPLEELIKLEDKFSVEAATTYCFGFLREYLKDAKRKKAITTYTLLELFIFYLNNGYFNFPVENEKVLFERLLSQYSSDILKEFRQSNKKDLWINRLSKDIERLQLKEVLFKSKDFKGSEYKKLLQSISSVSKKDVLISVNKAFLKFLLIDEVKHEGIEVFIKNNLGYFSGVPYAAISSLLAKQKISIDDAEYDLSNLYERIFVSGKKFENMKMSYFEIRSWLINQNILRQFDKSSFETLAKMFDLEIIEKIIQDIKVGLIDSDIIDFINWVESISIFTTLKEENTLVGILVSTEWKYDKKGAEIRSFIDYLIVKMNIPFDVVKSFIQYKISSLESSPFTSKEFTYTKIAAAYLESVENTDLLLLRNYLSDNSRINFHQIIHPNHPLWFEVKAWVQDRKFVFNSWLKLKNLLSGEDFFNLFVSIYSSIDIYKQLIDELVYVKSDVSDYELLNNLILQNFSEIIKAKNEKDLTALYTDLSMIKSSFSFFKEDFPTDQETTIVSVDEDQYSILNIFKIWSTDKEVAISDSQLDEIFQLPLLKSREVLDFIDRSDEMLTILTATLDKLSSEVNQFLFDQVFKADASYSRIIEQTKNLLDDSSIKLLLKNFLIIKKSKSSNKSEVKASSVDLFPNTESSVTQRPIKRSSSSSSSKELFKNDFLQLRSWLTYFMVSKKSLFSKNQLEVLFSKVLQSSDKATMLRFIEEFSINNQQLLVSWIAEKLNPLVVIQFLSAFYSIDKKWSNLLIANIKELSNVESISLLKRIVEAKGKLEYDDLFDEDALFPISEEQETLKSFDYSDFENLIYYLKHGIWLEQFYEFEELFEKIISVDLNQLVNFIRKEKNPRPILTRLFYQVDFSLVLQILAVLWANESSYLSFIRNKVVDLEGRKPQQSILLLFVYDLLDLELRIDEHDTLNQLYNRLAKRYEGRSLLANGVQLDAILFFDPEIELSTKDELTIISSITNQDSFKEYAFRWIKHNYVAFIALLQSTDVEVAIGDYYHALNEEKRKELWIYWFNQSNLLNEIQRDYVYDYLIKSEALVPFATIEMALLKSVDSLLKLYSDVDYTKAQSELVKTVSKASFTTLDGSKFDISLLDTFDQFNAVFIRFTKPKRVIQRALEIEQVVALLTTFPEDELRSLGQHILDLSIHLTIHKRLEEVLLATASEDLKSYIMLFISSDFSLSHFINLILRDEKLVVEKEEQALFFDSVFEKVVYNARLDLLSVIPSYANHFFQWLIKSNRLSLFLTSMSQQLNQRQFLNWLINELYPNSNLALGSLTTVFQQPTSDTIIGLASTLLDNVEEGKSTLGDNNDELEKDVKLSDSIEPYLHENNQFIFAEFIERSYANNDLKQSTFDFFLVYLKKFPRLTQSFQQWLVSRNNQQQLMYFLWENLNTERYNSFLSLIYPVYYEQIYQNKNNWIQRHSQLDIPLVSLSIFFDDYSLSLYLKNPTKTPTALLIQQLSRKALESFNIDRTTLPEDYPKNWLPLDSLLETDITVSRESSGGDDNFILKEALLVELLLRGSISEWKRPFTQVEIEKEANLKFRIDAVWKDLKDEIQLVDLFMNWRHKLNATTFYQSILAWFKEYDSLNLKQLYVDRYAKRESSINQIQEWLSSITLSADLVIKMESAIWAQIFYETTDWAVNEVISRALSFISIKDQLILKDEIEQKDQGLLSSSVAEINKHLLTTVASYFNKSIGETELELGDSSVNKLITELRLDDFPILLKQLNEAEVFDSNDLLESSVAINDETKDIMLSLYSDKKVVLPKSREISDEVIVDLIALIHNYVNSQHRRTKRFEEVFIAIKELLKAYFEISSFSELKSTFGKFSYDSLLVVFPLLHNQFTLIDLLFNKAKGIDTNIVEVHKWVESYVPNNVVALSFEHLWAKILTTKKQLNWEELVGHLFIRIYSDVIKRDIIKTIEQSNKDLVENEQPLNEDLVASEINTISKWVVEEWDKEVSKSKLKLTESLVAQQTISERSLRFKQLFSYLNQGFYLDSTQETPTSLNEWISLLRRDLQFDIYKVKKQLKVLVQHQHYLDNLVSKTETAFQLWFVDWLMSNLVNRKSFEQNARLVHSQLIKKSVSITLERVIQLMTQSYFQHFLEISTFSLSEWIGKSATLSAEFTKNDLALLDGYVSITKDGEDYLDLYQKLAQDDIEIEDEPIEGMIHLPYAGIVIFGPYLMRLFEMLGYLTADRKAFQSVDKSCRAVYALGLLNGLKLELNEPDYLIHKILCGLPIALPLPPKPEFTESELATITSMLNGVKNNWPKMQRSSIEAMQESFINRSGVLSFHDTYWQVHIERKTMDILLQSIPWSYAKIKLPWMENPINVEWL